MRADGYEFEPLPNRPGWKLIRGARTAEMRVYFVSLIMATSHVDEIDPFVPLSDPPD